MRFPTVVGGVLLSVALGCSGGDDEPQTGRVSLALDSDPVGDYREIQLDLQRVDGQFAAPGGDSGWCIVGTPDRVIKLGDSLDEKDAPLPAQRNVPVGHYGQLRLTLGPKSTIRLQDGRLSALAVPLGFGSGLQLGCDFEIPVDGLGQGQLRFDGMAVVQKRRGDVVSYSLEPAGQQADKNATTGTISGRITDEQTGVGLSGVAIFAEEVDASGRTSIVRTAVTSDTGAYTLTLLPLGHSYFVVSRPYVNGVFYEPQASGKLNLSSRDDDACWSAKLTLNSGLGSTFGEVTPTAAIDQSDQLSLVRQFAQNGSLSPWLIVDTTIAQRFASETYSFASVPSGTYAVWATRSTVYYDGSISATATAESAPFTITANATTTANIAYP